MRAVSAVEADVPGFVFVDHALAVRRRRFERRVVLVDDNYIFVVEMHRRRLAGVPAITPYGDLVGVKQLDDMRSRKRVRITSLVWNRRRGMIFQLDHDGVSASLAGDVARMAED